MRKFILVVFMVLALAGVAFADGQVDLNWPTPTTNCDTTPLTDLAGYTVKWWFSDTPGTIVEQDVGLVNAVTIDLIGNVEGKTVIFVVVSYDTSGNRSDDPQGCGTSPEANAVFPITFPSYPATLDAQVR